MAKHTVESLMENGWIGVQRHKITARETNARYVLDSLAWTINNKPYRLKLQFKDNKVYVWFENENWTPPKNHYEYMYRDLTEQEAKNKNLTIKEVI